MPYRITDALASGPAPEGSDRQRRAVVGDGLNEVLDAVRLGGLASRFELARRTGLGRAVIAQRVQDLMAMGLLDETGIGPSTGGRPARRLRFVAEAGHLIAVDLGATSIDAALTDLAGTILRHVSEPADIAAGPDRILGRVESLVDELRSGSDAPGALRGIGIGVPGPVEFRTGRPVSPPIMPGWDRYPIRKRFEGRFGAPVWVDNDVNVMALGESRYGVGRGHADMVYVKIGTGIGAGLISEGALHRGAQGSAGDVGHIQVVDDPDVLCRCGNVGCLEALAGGAAIARDAEAAARAGRSRRLARTLSREGRLTAADVAEAARHGDGVSVELLQRCGRLVGTMLAGVVNFFNPSLIVIGGGVAEAGDVLLAVVRHVVYGRSLPLATRELAIQPTTLPGVAGVLGAAAMVTDELFSRSGLAAWQADVAEAPEGLLAVAAGV